MQKTHADIQKGSNQNEKKVRQIGEILGMLEETNRDKSWILHQIKKHDIKVQVKPAMNSYDILSCCAPDFIATLLRILRGEDIAGLGKLETKTMIYHWFFTDIVAGSNPSIATNAQVRKIRALNELISQTDIFQNKNSAATIVLPTGDGMAIGFGDNPEKPVLLAIELYKKLLKYNESKRGKDKLFIRVGLESGPVFFVKDLEGKDNVWGPGIIITRRIMDLCGDMQIFASSRISDELVRAAPHLKNILHQVGSYKTKYGEKLQLYNIYGEGFGSKVSLGKPEKTTKNLQRDAKATTNFLFNEIEVLLDVKDVKTMQTHHTWVWDMVNVSKEARSQIFYYLDGHFPEDMAEMNISVTDREGTKLELSSIGVNKPHHKEFHVRLAEPVLPKERTRLKLQYDCTEPDRAFPYRFPSGAKRFSYTCFLPKEIDLKNRILKVDLGTGYKIHATPPAKIKHANDRILITWEKKNIVPQDAYQFEW